jgi:hypothetical protein
MTAEIAIMNREAIALAADSAVTMTGRTDQKIFTSANKLFALSKYHPVGMMIYGSANFMDVSWETIIKIYRNKLRKKKFDTLREYADDFIAFLDNGNPLFPNFVQEKHLRNSIYSYFILIKNTSTKEVDSKISQKGKITEEETKQIVSETIKEHYDNWEKESNIPSIPKSYNKNIIIKYGRIISKTIEEVFEKLPISKSHSNKLKKIAASLFSKFPESIKSTDISGVVIAGFGEKDTFPSLNSFLMEGIANDKLKYEYEEDKSGKIDFKMSALIIPFAQRDMVITFMEGIDFYLRDYMEGRLFKIFAKYPEIIAESIAENDNNKKNMIREKLKEVSKKIFKDYQDNVQSYRRENYINPVISVVSMLPKDELSAMAETLVNLTSFKRKVTMERETVGGPIDVAVISKGDGFIWIKRKHYFKAELNPQFFANYYREV